MINKLKNNKKTKKYRAGSKGKANLSKRIKDKKTTLKNEVTALKETKLIGKANLSKRIKDKSLKKEMELIHEIRSGNLKKVEELVKSGEDVNVSVIKINDENIGKFLLLGPYFTNHIINQTKVKNKELEYYRLGSVSGPRRSWVGEDNITFLKRIFPEKAIETIITFSPIIIAILEKDYNMVKLLIYLGANVNPDYSYNYIDDSPLINAISVNNLEIVKLLLEKGANLREAYDDTVPLIHAIKQDNLEIVKLLLEKGADVNVEYENDNYGYDGMVSPLNVAIFHQYYTKSNPRPNASKIVDILLKNGADPDVKLDNLYLYNNDEIEGPSAIRLAYYLGNTEIIELLLKNGLDYTDELLENIQRHNENHADGVIIRNDQNHLRQLDGPWGQDVEIGHENIQWLRNLLDKYPRVKVRFNHIINEAYYSNDFELFKFCLERNVKLDFPHKVNGRITTFFEYITEINNDPKKQKFKEIAKKAKEKLMAKEVVEKKNIGENAITEKISSYLGGKRKTKKRHLKNKLKKTRRSKK